MTGKIKDAAMRRASQSLLTPESLFRGRRSRLVLSAAALATVILLCSVFFNYGPKLYRHWQQSRLLHRAALLLHEEKFSEAAATAREIVKLTPRSLPAYYILAEAAEKQNLEEAVSWRAQIARLLPSDPDSQLNLASAALRFGQLDLARKALDHISHRDRDRAAFHVVAGWLARAEGNFREQEEQFAAAVEKEPVNDLYHFNLAALQIQSKDAEKRTRAHATLDRLSKLAPFRSGALRALLNDAVERNNLAGADNLAQQLQMSPQVTFGDYLLCLNFYRKLDQKKFRILLERVKPFAARNSSDLASLVNWMNENGLAGDAVKWIDKLPLDELTAPSVSIAIADAYASAKNWARLKHWTRTRPWGEADYLRHAYQAIAIEQSQSGSGTARTEFETLWRSAEQAAKQRAERELDLARLASKWNLNEESEQLWLRVASNPPMRREALDALRRIYRTTNNLGKLYEVLQRLHKSSPNEASITADLARLGLNLERNTEASHELAKEAYDRAPNELNCAVTYAFSLYRLGRGAEGLAIIQKLPPDQLHDPHAAVYAVLLLLDAKEIDAVEDYIAAADDANIYIEEKKLLDDAKKQLVTASETLPSSVSSASAELSPTPGSTP